MSLSACDASGSSWRSCKATERPWRGSLSPLTALGIPLPSRGLHSLGVLRSFEGRARPISPGDSAGAPGRIQRACSSALGCGCEAHAVVGQCEQARREVQAALTLSRDNFTLENAGRILALCGRPTESAVLSKELVDRLPEATLVAHLAIPVTRAAVALEQGDAVRAIEVLEGVIHYERALGTDFGLCTCVAWRTFD